MTFKDDEQFTPPQLARHEMHPRKVKKSGGTADDHEMIGTQAARPGFFASNTTSILCRVETMPANRVRLIPLGRPHG